jgi:hypothetical protein
MKPYRRGREEVAALTKHVVKQMLHAGK